MRLMNHPLTIARREVRSRLIMWTGRFSAPDAMRGAREASGGELTVMLIGWSIGSNRGIRMRDQLGSSMEQATVAVVVDAGSGASSRAAEGMEMGADAVVVNKAIAGANDPNGMAVAFKMAVEAGRAAYEIRLGGQQGTPSPTSPPPALFS